MELLRGHRRIPTIFHLAGINENDMTDALGVTLSRSPSFVRFLLRDLVGYDGDVTAARVWLQAGEVSGGITDVRITISEAVDVIVEAKRGVELPDVSQLKRYAPRLLSSTAGQKLLVSLTHATKEFAAERLPEEVDGVRVAHRSWSDVLQSASAARAAERSRGRVLLDEFIRYLGELSEMHPQLSNMVYVVALASGSPVGWTISWIDIVERRARYFLPVRGIGQVPNYLGFRYNGRLQRIHYVRSVSIFTDPSTIFPEAAPDQWEPHYLVQLGEPIVPSREIRAGPRVRQATRVRCMLDTLLTSQTISDALSETERRLRLG